MYENFQDIPKNFPYSDAINWARSRIKYSKTSQSADFETKQNTADFEIRRLQVTTRLDMLFSPTLPE